MSDTSDPHNWPKDYPRVLKSAFRHSDTLGALAAALAKAQGAIEAAKRDSENPYYESKYADIGAVWAVCRGPLSANEIAVVQGTRLDSTRVVQIQNDDGTTRDLTVPQFTETTKLIHSSGEWIETDCTAEGRDFSAQAFGSIHTYLRRYGLQGAVGVATEDDDGEAASGGHAQAPRKQRTAAAPSTEPKIKPAQLAKWREELWGVLMNMTAGSEDDAKVISREITAGENFEGFDHPRAMKHKWQFENARIALQKRDDYRAWREENPA